MIKIKRKDEKIAIEKVVFLLFAGTNFEWSDLRWRLDLLTRHSWNSTGTLAFCRTRRTHNSSIPKARSCASSTRWSGGNRMSAGPVDGTCILAWTTSRSTGSPSSILSSSFSFYLVRVQLLSQLLPNLNCKFLYNYSQ